MSRHAGPPVLRAGVIAGLVLASVAWRSSPALDAQVRARPVPAPFDAASLARIGPLVEEAMAARLLPGAVVIVGRRSGNAYEKAFGARALAPSREAMTVDTVFDAASLTKVVATTTSVMQLVEEGRIQLTDRVATYIPEFAKYGKRDITLRHLMTHTSGLRPDLDLADRWHGTDAAIRLATEEVPLAAPDEKFVYSDINYFVLGEIVARVRGATLPDVTRQRIFAPLEMRDTMFLPPASLRPRIAPTEACLADMYPCGDPGAAMLRGVVHDPTSRRMDGVAGHAGMFTTAGDLARFARMLLGRGALDGVRILSPLSVARMTSPSTPPGMVNVRGLGWDIDSSFSVNRGELMAPGSFGHTGFTGTGVWIDPASDLFVVFMSNRVHPDGKGDVASLRARIASVAAAALLDVAPSSPHRWGGQALAPSGVAPGESGKGARPPPVLDGIDVLRAENFARLKGRRVGLVTNHTGIARDGASTIDLLHAAKDVTLVALFSPEHGIRGALDEDVPSSKDERTGLPIHSLYGATQRPTPAMLEGIDTLVVDLQDVGSRFYTYTATMAYVMEEAAPRKIRVVVLDRPNPVNGWQIEGPLLDADAVGNTGYLPTMPVRHGMTMGELARLYNGEKKIGADLDVVAMQGWSRGAWFDETGQPWVNPSPNMRNLLQATLYPGIGAIEFANVSVGRGTDTPFEQVGGPWIDGVALAAALKAAALPGVTFYPVRFTPTSSKYAGESCGGVFIVVTDRQALRPVRLGAEILSALARLYPRSLDMGRTWKLLGLRDSISRIEAGESAASVAASWEAGEARWRQTRAKYLLY